MTPINFEGSNKELGAPKGQEDNCQPLPVYTNGNVVVSCWAFTDAEVEYIIKHRSMYFALWSGQTQYPMLPMAEDLKFPLTTAPFTRNQYAWTWVVYNMIAPRQGEIEEELKTIKIYVNGDIPHLNLLIVNDKSYQVSGDQEASIHWPEYQLKPGDLYFRLPDQPELKTIFDTVYHRLMAEANDTGKVAINKQVEQLYVHLSYQPVLIECLSNGDEVLRYY